MTRFVVIGALCLILGACNVVATKDPLFTKADEAGAAPLKPGLWRLSNGEDCNVDEAKPLVDWPSCAGGLVIKDGGAGYYERDSGSPVWSNQPFVLAAGTPRIAQVQAKISGDVKVSSNPFVYAGARATQTDAAGRIVAMNLWPVQCGAPPPGDKAELTAKLLPGLEAKPGDTVCTTSSIPALRAAAKASEAWAPKPITAKWLRDAPG